MKLLDGRPLAQSIRDELRSAISALPHRKPGLTVILVGDDPASHIYVSKKQQAALDVGMVSTVLKFEATVSEQEILNTIDRLNHDHEVDGILVQLPLPEHICEDRVTMALDPAKDVDGFHPLNMGEMLRGNFTHLLPCTPLGVVELLRHYEIPTQGKEVVVCGRSNIVGKPIAAMLGQDGFDATVTLCHIYTDNLASHTKRADIVITAIGIPHIIKGDMLKPGATVIDIGISRQGSRVVGDVEFDEAAKIVAAITPVPGGVGPMTVATLLQNTFKSFSSR